MDDGSKKSLPRGIRNKKSKAEMMSTKIEDKNERFQEPREDKGPGFLDAESPLRSTTRKGNDRVLMKKEEN